MNAVDRAQGELGGAGIDVLEVEQMDDFVRGLADTPNLHLSPHAAWYSTEAAVRLAQLLPLPVLASSKLALDDSCRRLSDTLSESRTLSPSVGTFS